MLCEVCQKESFKYKCPKCLKKTCSLKCSKLHKSNDKCTGIANDSTMYISSETLKKADDEKHENNIMVQRDFNFLSNLKRKIELDKNDAFLKNKKTLLGNKRARYDGEIQRIIRRGVNCLLLPRGMQRSQRNRSKWDKPLDTFVWSIEWILCPPRDKLGEEETFEHISHRVKETDGLLDGISNVVYDKCCSIFSIENQKEDIEIKETKAEKSGKLLSAGVKFYMKYFPQNAIQVMDTKELVELDISSKCIAELFRNKTVIEFPTIYVAKDEQDLPQPYKVVQEPRLPDLIVRSKPFNHAEENNDDDDGDNAAPEESTTKPVTEGQQPHISIPQKQVSEDSDDDYDPTASFKL
ncbi:hypothetical protein KAFR_0E01400 [Kazachstania africana CBS 2517]|uniref:HIT-type domain-containing protein n=1 Tax=Kazachstania africana (strain ATCC 22294 / BCRC 22015 / CBS 2517 / CECT 1963 / NBRC 1671 / NRRL Y-8276) TaxID=1071382 RepID=H2AV94_KAZAF|nr:hypothetical protein KAFR_0E01400 [Kazachstania africana CBS 2517]CCF58294.1 hypothetical protein KAFR_0E01400 [Kazachstania africana CBS 2517]